MFLPHKRSYFKLLFSCDEKSTLLPRNRRVIQQALSRLSRKCQNCLRIPKFTPASITASIKSACGGGSKHVAEEVLLLLAIISWGIVEEANICFRKTVGEGELVLRNIPTEMISCESTLNSPVVKSLWENIVLESETNETCATQKLCLEIIVKLYLRVRSFSYARD